MDSHHRRLGQGFNWLGGAMVIAKMIDFSTMLVMLLLLTKQQVGIASLVISFGMIIEGLNGLGTSEALLQTPSVTELQLDSLFWYVTGAATLVAITIALAAPCIAAWYGVAGITGYLFAVAAKQPIVGAALIPLAMLNRELRYERIAIISVCATLAAALTRLGLGAAGAGAWALIAGYVSSGLYTLVGATIGRSFRPALQCNPAAIMPLIRFGSRAVTANVSEQVFKNIDFLLIGWFYGAAPLAIYRVAFDIAMEPAMALGTLVNRTALPVFARVSAVKLQLTQTLTWSLHKIAVLVAPFSVGLVLAADPLTALIHDRQGHSYAAAALPLKLLAAAALLRVISQLLAPMMMGAGRPGAAARLSAATLLLLGGFILAACLTFSAKAGIVVVSAVWLGIYPFLLVWGSAYLRRHWDISAPLLARAFIVPFAGVALMVLAAQLARSLLPTHDPKIELGIAVIATALTYAGLALHGKYRPYAVTGAA